MRLSLTLKRPFSTVAIDLDPLSLLVRLKLWEMSLAL